MIRSSMFLKKKFHPVGSFDEYKARLVAGGDLQDRKPYEDLSSPNVSTSSVFTIISIAAHESIHVAVVDIGSVFLNVKMQKGVPVYMRLNNTMSEYLIQINPKYAEFSEKKKVLLKKYHPHHAVWVCGKCITVVPKFESVPKGIRVCPQ
jgi:hypothetical protein